MSENFNRRQTLTPNRVENIYKKVNQREHVLLRPDTYVGTDNFEDLADKGGRLVRKTCTYVPALFKIFDEILVNAADNKQRDPEGMTWIKVCINRESGTVSVANNGKGIPVQMHKKEKMYVPQLIFGNLLTGSNYNDDKKKVTGGRNGFGAKLANIFSTKFIVETVDSKLKKKYVQVFRNNMTKTESPVITDAHKTQSYTKITFKPDLEKFGMFELNEEICNIFKKRTYDLAGVTDKSVRVYLNGEKLHIKNFPDYVKLCSRSCLSTDGTRFEQVSFVNSIATTKGGTHVDFIVNQLVSVIQKECARKNKKAKALSKAATKNFICVFINCLIENPSFDSQTKEALTTQHKDFVVSKSMGIVDAAMQFANFRSRNVGKQATKLKKIRGIPKLDDANKAGTSKSYQYVFIIIHFHGDSAKTLAVSGLSIVGRDFYGVFPLKGKPLNVREAKHSQVSNNDEIQNIIKIMGIRRDVSYDTENIKKLRYGSILIMADQDYDGSHIKGLLLNFLHWFNPSLMQQILFHTVPEYETWKSRNETLPKQKGWHIKYYKGLGTSTSKEAKQYFANLDTNVIPFKWIDGDAELIKLAFSKDNADDWIGAVKAGTYVDFSMKEMTYKDFFNKEFVLFSQASRKVLFACFKRKLTKELKVAQLAGYVSEHAAYHHGEASLMGTIVGMAQNYVGSNNLNLLYPGGQFGTRLQGGKDSASPRYIFTRLAEITRHIFHPDDDAILDYLDDDGISVEPSYYCPVIPLVLVNGCAGIGTGWSTEIPNYNPKDIINCLRQLLSGGDSITVAKNLVPWYRGFQGTTEVFQKKNAFGFMCKGLVEVIEPGPGGILHISELPVGMWTQKFKELLENQSKSKSKSKGKKKTDSKPRKQLVVDYNENHTDATVSFTITLAPTMTSKLSNSNMILIESETVSEKVTKFKTISSIIDRFYKTRLRMYGHRKRHLLKTLKAEHTRLANQMRFVTEVVEGKLVISRRKEAELVAEMKINGYKEKKKDDEEKEKQTRERGYDYMLNMNIRSLTVEKVQKLKKELDEKTAVMRLLQKTSIQELWEADLIALEASIIRFEDAMQADADAEREAKEAAQNGNKKKRRKRVVKKKPKVKKEKVKEEASNENVKAKANTKPISQFFEPKVKKEPKITKKSPTSNISSLSIPNPEKSKKIMKKTVNISDDSSDDSDFNDLPLSMYVFQN
eukprot:GSMAST32.ASY1.ANO1.1919.1 assembled CDS